VRRFAALAGAVACALAVAAAASPTIAIGRGIAGVRLGMSPASVRARLGKPVTVVHGKNEFGAYTELRYRGYVVVLQENDRVTSIVTTLAREKTPAGIGVGSSWSQVQKRVPRVRCDGTATLGDCHVGLLLPAKTVTDFFVVNGRVNRVVVGIVLD
jgi:hypothetical protein